MQHIELPLTRPKPQLTVACMRHMKWPGQHSPQPGHSKGACISVSASSWGAGTCDMACALLAVAEELGLAHLQSVTLDLIVHNYPAASACAGYAALTKGQTDLVTSEACRLVASMQRLMREVAC